MIQKPLTILCFSPIGSIQSITKKFSFPIIPIKGTYSKVQFIFKNNTLRILHNNIDIRSYAFVWLSSGWNNRDVAYAIHLYLEFHKTPHTPVEKNTSKLTDCVVFALQSIPIPNTVFTNYSSINKDLPILQTTCEYPLIIKDIRGSRGKHSLLVASESDFIKALGTLPHYKNFLCQTFIPNEYDWGIMIANGTIVAGEKSYPQKGEFRNNTCNGATENFVDISKIPQSVKAMALQAHALLGLFWSRVDIIIDKNTQQPYLLEVNRFPGITVDSQEETGAYTFLASQINTLQ